jgi:hypothetical protein
MMLRTGWGGGHEPALAVGVLPTVLVALLVALVVVVAVRRVRRQDRIPARRGVRGRRPARGRAESNL